MAAYYNEKEYGCNILAIYGERQIKSEVIKVGHAVYLPTKNGLWGVRGTNEKEEVAVSYGLEEALVQYKKQNFHCASNEYTVINLNEISSIMNVDWRETNENLVIGETLLREKGKIKKFPYPKK